MSTNSLAVFAENDLLFLDFLAVLRHLFLHDAGEGREHQFGIGVFVVDDEQAVVGAAVERDEANIVVVVAEQLFLGSGRLVLRVELRAVGEDLVAPAKQDVGIVTFGHMVLFVDAGFDLGKVEARTLLGACLFGGQESERADGGRDRGNCQRAADERPAREAAVDDVAHRRIGGTVVADIFQLFPAFRQRLEFGLFRLGEMLVHDRVSWLNDGNHRARQRCSSACTSCPMTVLRHFREEITALGRL